MFRPALAAMVLSTPALAHGGPEGHAHPHGLEGLVIVVIVASVGWLIWKATR